MSAQPQEDVFAQQKEEDIHKMLICKVRESYLPLFPYINLFLDPRWYQRYQLQNEEIYLQEG